MGVAETEAFSWNPDSFVWNERTPLRDWRFPVYSGISYIFTIFALQHVMKAREPLKLKMAAFSLVIFVGQMYETIRASQSIGVHDVFCWQSHGPPQGRLYFWSYLFYLSKYYELLDTVLLVFKKKPLDFLHCYHHSIVPFSAWLGFCGWFMPILTGCLFNSLVHVVMYYYYMLVTLGKSVWWKKYLTVFQIIQFCSGGVFTCAFYLLFFKNLRITEGPKSYSLAFDKGCQADVASVLFVAAVNVSFLWLFCDFYFKTYKRKGPAVVNSNTHVNGVDANGATGVTHVIKAVKGGKIE